MPKILKIKFQQFFLGVSVLFTLIIIVCIGLYLRTRINNAFYEMIAMTQNNHFQQCTIDLNEFYTQVFNTAKYIQDSDKFYGMVKRYNEFHLKDAYSELTMDEIYEKYELKKSIEEFIHQIVVQNRMWSLNYGKTIRSLYQDIAAVMPDDTISSEGMISNIDIGITDITAKASDEVRFFPNSLLSNSSIKAENESPFILFNIMENGEKLCSVFILINNSYIEQTIPNSQNIIVTNDDSYILYKGSNVDASGTKYDYKDQEDADCEKYFERDRNLLIKTTQLSVDKIKVFYKTDIGEYQKVKLRHSQYLLFAMILSLILVSFISHYQAKRIILPVNQLNRQITSFPDKEPDLNEFNIKKSQKAFSLYERLTYYFIGTIILPFILFIGVYYFTSLNALKEYIDNYSQSIMETEANTISNIIERKANSFSMFLNNPNVLKTMTQPNINSEDFNDALEQAVFMGIGKSRIMLTDKNGNNIMYNHSTVIDNPISKMELSEYKSFLQGKWELKSNLLGEYTISLRVPVFSPLKDGKLIRVGMAALFIDLREIESIFYNLDSIERKVYLKYQDSGLFDVYQRTKVDADFNVIKEGFSHNYKSTIQVSKTIGILDWEVITIFSKSYIDAKTNSIKDNCLYCLILAILLTIIYSFFISKVVLRPVNRINYYFNTVELDSVSDIDIDEFYIDEIDKIGNNFIRMMERIEQLIDDLMMSQYNNFMLEKKGKMAQFKALQAQITPHFLFNTLDTIINLVQSIQIEKAVSMIQALGDLFRYSITDNEDTISVGEEIKYAVSYANIMTIRYMEKVHFTWDIDDEIEKYECVRMILQPLIENCVIHALDQAELEVIIRCKKYEENILFSVKDNGKGIAEGDLEELRSRIKAENHCGANIGLNNVHLRLKLIYGELHDISITSSRGEGTNIVVSIPARIKQKEPSVLVK